MKLSDRRYEEIKAIVVDLYKRYKVSAIPINPWCLAESMGIILAPYSTLPGTKAKLAALKLNKDGFKLRLQSSTGDNQWCIYYNDIMNTSLERQRFTILHEIGHIVLGHRQESELAEAEANFFAKYAIAPPMLVHVIKPSDYIELADAFGLSAECAYYSMNYYNKWLFISSYRQYEYALVDLFTYEDKDGIRILRKGA